MRLGQLCEDRRCELHPLQEGSYAAQGRDSCTECEVGKFLQLEVPIARFVRQLPARRRAVRAASHLRRRHICSIVILADLRGWQILRARILVEVLPAL